MKVVISSLIAAAFVIGQPLLADEQQDVADLRALDQAYAAEWMSGNADGVLALFTDDATLVPHHGDTPIKGRDAIRGVSGQAKPVAGCVRSLCERPLLGACCEASRALSSDYSGQGSCTVSTGSQDRQQ